MRDGADARPPKGLQRRIGARDAPKTMTLLELLNLFVDGGAYWATTRQSMPVPFSLAHAACPSCALANGPNRTR